MRTCAIVFCFVVTSIHSAHGQLNPIKPPPLPDFKTPVDYTAWYFEQFAPRSESDALPLYDPLFFGPEARKLKLDATGNARIQMVEILNNPQDWKVTDKPDLAAWIQRLEKKYKQPLMEAATKKHMTVRRLNGLKFLCDRPVSRFVNGRALGQMMFARGWRVDGNVVKTEYLIDAAQSNLALADHMSRLPSLEEQFFSAGQRNVVYTQVLTALRSFMHRTHVWDEIMVAFDQFDCNPVTQLYARSLYFSEASALQQLQHFCMDGLAPGTNSKPKINQKTVDQFFGATMRNQKRVHPTCAKLASADPVVLANAIHNYYEQMRLLLAKPYVVDLKSQIAKIEKEYWEGFDGMECLVPQIGFAVQTTFRTEALRRGSRLFLEKSMHYKRTGIWPRSLDVLKHPAVAYCRIDPYTGKDFLFRPGGDAEVVYSVGVDGVDDKSDMKKDIVVWANVYTEKQGVVSEEMKKNVENATKNNPKSPKPKTAAPRDTKTKDAPPTGNTP
ncbi:MAG: hypothetical protein DHS20C16_22780 [Phycisphaerae bacterium]|nr:MAG: hypothetical protein DHS20C16_22780 [Phycisphaerae bacterium]